MHPSIKRLATKEVLQKVLVEGDLPECESGEALFPSLETLVLAAVEAMSVELFEQQLTEATVVEQRPASRGLRNDSRFTSTRHRSARSVHGYCEPVSA